MLDCPPELDPLLVDFCSLAAQIGAILGNQILYEVRNRAADPYVGPLGEGAGKLNVGRALAALRDGVVVYSAASGSGADAGTGPRDLQGSWQIGATTRRRDAHAALRRPRGARVRLDAGSVLVRAREPVRRQPGDHCRQDAWSIDLPGTVNVSRGAGRRRHAQGEGPVERRSRPLHGHRGRHGSRTGRCCASPSSRRSRCTTRTWRVGSRRRPGDRRVRRRRVREVRHDLAVRRRRGGHGRRLRLARVRRSSSAPGSREARFRVHDAAAGDETYDLYVYGADYALRASTHPFASDGVTDVQANNARGPVHAGEPADAHAPEPAAGRYYVAVSRAKVGLLPGSGDFGAFVLALDEVR